MEGGERHVAPETDPCTWHPTKWAWGLRQRPKADWVCGSFREDRTAPYFSGLKSLRTPHSPTVWPAQENAEYTMSSGQPSHCRFQAPVLGLEGHGQQERHQRLGASLSVSGAACPLASTGAKVSTHNNPGRGFLVGLQHGLISQATQGLLDGGVQGGGQVDGDTRGTDASLPAVKPTAGQRLLRGLYIWQLQIWRGRKESSRSPLTTVRYLGGCLSPFKGLGTRTSCWNAEPLILSGGVLEQLKSWALELHGPGLVMYQSWGLRQVTAPL